MLIMMIFLALTAILVIGTIIYLGQKKKSNTIKQMGNVETKEKGNKKQLADILEFKIQDNLIVLGNRYSMVVSLGNIDYNILSQNEQEAVENVLIQTVLAIDYPIQFFSTTEFIDTSKITSYMYTNKVVNEKVLEYRNYLAEYLENLMESRSISIVKNYAIISYDGLYENATVELNRQVASFKESLRSAKINCAILEESELYDLIYRELNKNSAFKISNFAKGGLFVGKEEKTNGN